MSSNVYNTIFSAFAFMKIHRSTYCRYLLSGLLNTCIKKRYGYTDASTIFHMFVSIVNLKYCKCFGKSLQNLNIILYTL